MEALRKSLGRPFYRVDEYFVKRAKHIGNYLSTVLLLVWALVEIITCSLVMVYREKGKERLDNFMYRLCGEGDSHNKNCENFMDRALVARIILSLVLFIGVLTVCTIDY